MFSNIPRPFFNHCSLCLYNCVNMRMVATLERTNLKVSCSSYCDKSYNSVLKAQYSKSRSTSKISNGVGNISDSYENVDSMKKLNHVKESTVKKNYVEATDSMRASKHAAENIKVNAAEAKKSSGRGAQVREEIQTNIVTSTRDEILSRVVGLAEISWPDVDIQFKQCSFPTLHTNWPSILMKSFSNLKGSPKVYLAATSLLKFVKNRDDLKHSIVIDVAYIVICAKASKTEETLLLYDNLCLKNDVFDSICAEMLIEALSLTDRWKEECRRLLDILCLSSNKSVKALSHIAKAALSHGDLDLAEESIQEIWDLNVNLKNFTRLIDDVFAKFIDVDIGDGKIMEHVLLLMRRYRWIVSPDLAALIKDCFESFRHNGDAWQASFAQVDKRGICSACNEKLNDVALSPKEFNDMRTAFLDMVIIGKDLFEKTSPEELHQFNIFLKNNAPFDVVLDALNIAYGTQSTLQKDRAALLSIVVEHFWKKGNKILVLGRRHMQKWHRPYMDLIHQRAKCFFIDNISEDDPFLLYATMYSGPETIFVTRDEMRNHKFLLEFGCCESFMQWQRGHQVIFDRNTLDSSGKATPSFKWFDAHDTRVQCSEHGWHVPLNDGSEQLSYSLATGWLCLKRLYQSR